MTSLSELTIAYYSNKYKKYIIVFQGEVNRSIRNHIGRTVQHRIEEKGYYMYSYTNEYNKDRVYYVREPIKIVFNNSSKLEIT